MPSYYGNVRSLLTIQRRSMTQDAAGEQSQTWTTAGQAWAEVKALSGRELEAAQSVRAIDTHQITLRYFPLLSAKDRLVWINPEGATVYYTLTDVQDLDKRHRWMECTASEGLTLL